MSDEQERALIGGGTPRYLTADLPGIGGAIKEQVSDFIVEELPLYTPLGKGEHTFFEIEKKGISTFQAVRTIARGLGVAPKRISYAGLKDAQAITCQVLSVDQVPPEAVTALDLDQIRILWAERHQKKLKIGHLRGNRFTIRIRGVAEEMLPAGQAIVDLLVRRGVPNWYGPQRFGQRGDSALLGKYVVDQDARAFVERLLGGPHPNESERVQEARARFDAGQWAEALAIFPHNMANERRALHRLIDTEGDAGRAYASVPKRFKIFLLSAYQSALFNRVLDARLETLDRVFVGDLAMKHPGRSVFRVEDEAAEQPRADRFEISPTGPLFGYKMIEARGRQGQFEDEILAGEGLSPESWRVGGGIKARGQRRALRFPVHEPELSFDEGVVLKFSLPRGCYATALLAEVMKVPLTSQVPEM
ncbi:MAG: tRNA pseudouridine(13) synthase TruD [Anaerolineae bacterium]